MGTSSVQDIVNGIREYTSSDYYVKLDTLMVAQGMIYDVVGFVLGLITILLALGMGLITALDICYITIPMFQDKVREARWDGSDGHGKVRFISNDARRAVDEAGLCKTGRSALAHYLLKRVKAYVICAIILFILIGGSNTIVPLISNIVMTFLQGFENISTN